MAYTTINKSTDYFNTKLYSGTDYAQSVTGVGFQPDYTWIKCRSHSGSNTFSHINTDSVRGANKTIHANEISTESTSHNTGYLASFDSDGFTTGSGSNGIDSVGGVGRTYASWNWKAGTTSGITTNGSTTITPTAYSFNATSGFSIISYNGNGTAGAGIPHGLGVAPKMVMIKNRDNVSGYGWYVMNTNRGAGTVLYLHSTDGSASNTTAYNSTYPDATNVYLGTNSGTNGNGEALIAYCFADVPGYSKFGKYTGNGNADGTFVYTGFKPAFILAKRADSADNWVMYDDKRSGYNPQNDRLYPNGNFAEEGTTDKMFDMLSNGFKARATWTTINASGGTYIYMAFGQSLVGSNNVPCTAR